MFFFVYMCMCMLVFTVACGTDTSVIERVVFLAFSYTLYGIVELFLYLGDIGSKLLARGMKILR